MLSPEESKSWRWARHPGKILPLPPSSIVDSKVFEIPSTGYTIQAAIFERVERAVRPYDISIRDIKWQRQYRIRKSIAKSFSDQNLSLFLLGSACHVHSPLTKQGINAGMMDAWNLCWKLALVIKKFMDSSLLSSYDFERRIILSKAVEFD